jgi:hypothetical protein
MATLTAVNVPGRIAPRGAVGYLALSFSHAITSWSTRPSAPGGDDTDCEEPRQNSSEYIHSVPLHQLRERSHADNATSLGAFSDDAMAAHQCGKSSTPDSQGRCRNTADRQACRRVTQQPSGQFAGVAATICRARTTSRTLANKMRGVGTRGEVRSRPTPMRRPAHARSNSHADTSSKLPSVDEMSPAAGTHAAIRPEGLRYVPLAALQLD